ncbi:hypothetical protein Acr_07g0008270 [Actinidia rufa]|uniref:Uncharacterized protein n=1 Tax=Actinidia rufa TaxID=165716 RepID=A0A7J0EW73_9ERIC|nr:hypothetical protein Acr_07g0008270 [Actinidia rufa]
MASNLQSFATLSTSPSSLSFSLIPSPPCWRLSLSRCSPCCGQQPLRQRRRPLRVCSDLLTGKSFTFALCHRHDCCGSGLHRRPQPSSRPPPTFRRLPLARPTLFPRHEIRFQTRSASEGFAVDDVDVVVPGLLYGRDVAVHGLGGILYFRSQVDLDHRLSPPPPLTVPVVIVVKPSRISSPGNISLNHETPPPANFSDRGVSEPPNAEGTEDRTVVSPSSDPASFDPFSPAESPEKADLLSSASRLSLESSIALITEPEATSQSIGEGWNLMQPFPTLAEATKPPEVPCPFDPQSLDCSWRES